MSRKEFLGYIGAAILAVVGVSSVIKALLHHSGSSSGHNLARKSAPTPFGGAKKSFLS